MFCFATYTANVRASVTRASMLSGSPGASGHLQRSCRWAIGSRMSSMRAARSARKRGRPFGPLRNDLRNPKRACDADHVPVESLRDLRIRRGQQSHQQDRPQEPDDPVYLRRAEPADADSTMPGNIRPGKPLFAFGTATANSCGEAKRAAEKIAKQALGMKTKHVQCKCAGR